MLLTNFGLYPQSAHAYERLAEACRDAANQPLAIQNDQMSLELNPLDAIPLAVLKKLRGEQKAASK